MPQVPAYRYDIFISAFEKYVHERQQEIAKADRLMMPYEIARRALEKARLTNIHKLHLRAREILIEIVPNDDDKYGAFDSLLQDIGMALVEAKLHVTGQWATEHGYGIDWNFRWSLKMQDTPSLRVYLNVPFSGTRYIKINEKKEATVTSTYTSEWLGQPKQVEVTHDPEAG